MSSRKPADAQALGIMILLCGIWGFQQITLKAAAVDVSPVLQIALRSGIAVVMAMALMVWQRHRPDWRHNGWPGLGAGLLFALEFLLLGEALRFTTASHGVVFLYTAPVFVALCLHFLLPAERLAPVQWLGVALAFFGIAYTFLGRPSDAAPQGDLMLGDLLALGAGLAWGATTVLVRCSRLATAPATETLAYQLLAGFVLLLGASYGLGQTHFNPTPVAWGSLLFQGLVVSFASYLAWFQLLRVYMASQLGVFSFMTPLFGVGFGIWLLNDPMDPAFGIGATLVVGGILLVSGYRWWQASA